MVPIEQAYWLRRKRLSLAKAQAAISAEARLIHFDLAGRYSVKAANCDPSPAAEAAAPTTDPQAIAPVTDPRAAPISSKD